MPPGRSTLAQAVLAAGLTCAFYAFGLDASPPHLVHDEIKFALQAHAIAETGRDLNGRLLPVYFLEPGFSVGRDPLCIYVTAGVLQFLPLSETSIRFASVLVAATAVGLTFVLAALLFGRASLAWAAAAMLALSPTFYIHSRLALSVIYPVPFTVLWLLLLHVYLTRQERRYAVGTGVALGAGVYSYLAAAIMMPLYLAATIVLLARRGDSGAGRLVVATFLVLMLPILVWQVVEPERYTNILSAYRFYDVEQMTPADKVGQLLSADSIRARVDTFWASFNPETLFFTGEPSMQISTREVGSLLTPVALFLATGIVVLLTSRRSSFGDLLLFGLLTSPLPGVIMLDTEIRRWLVFLPFAAIVSAVGVARWLDGPRWQRAVALIALALMVMQFASFTGDYFGSYRERASVWFGGNIRDAVHAVLDESRESAPATVFISTDIPWVEAYWRFYTTTRHQQWLLPRTEYVRLDASDTPHPLPDAIVVLPAGDKEALARLAQMGWQPDRTIQDLDGKPSIIIATPAKP